MNELVVKKQNFEKHVAKLDNLSKQNRQLPELQVFQERTGPFNWFAKKVTGEEMNAFGAQIQDNFIMLNEKTNQFYKQFIEIYNAFETLDKEYIAGIVGAFNQAIDATKKAEAAQKDIENTLSLLQKAVENMTDFNKKVSSELSIIDCDNWKENAIKHQRELDEVDAKAEYIIKTVNGYKDAHDQLIYELTNNIKIKKKYNRNLIICWSFSGTLILINVLLVVTFICLFLFGKISL